MKQVHFCLEQKILLYIHYLMPHTDWPNVFHFLPWLIDLEADYQLSIIRIKTFPKIPIINTYKYTSFKIYPSRSLSLGGIEGIF